MASTATELAPLTDAQAAALRARVLQLRAASAPDSGLSARRVAELVAAEPAFAAFATAGRVKKLWTKLNAAEAAAAARAAAASAPPPPRPPPPIDPEATLSAWPAHRSAPDALKKGAGCIFSTAEILKGAG